MLPARILLPLVLAVIGWLTLAPPASLQGMNETQFGVLGVRTWLDAGTWTTGRPWEFLANIAMFVPLGVLLRMSFPQARAVAVVIGAATIAGAIEVAQLPLDRVSDPRDLVANTLGALGGILLATVLGRRAEARRAEARRAEARRSGAGRAGARRAVVPKAPA